MTLPGYKATAVDSAGNILGSTTVEVRRAVDGALVQLYADAAGTTPIATNPFSADANGDFEFYAQPGTYLVTLGVGASPQVFPLQLVDGNRATFESRADFVAAIAAGILLEDGATVTAGGLKYVAKSGATGVSDLPGYVPFGDVYVNHFGDSGTSDDTALFTLARDYLAANGGGAALVKDGTYTFTDQSVSPTNWDDQICVHILDDNINFMAAPGALPTIQLADGEDAHLFKFGSRPGSDVGAVSVDGGGLYGLDLDGNRANQTLPTAADFHCGAVDISDNCSNIIVDMCRIHDTQYYGIGFQREGFVGCLVRNTIIEDVGADGIDAKDDNGTSINNRIEGVSVKRFGLALDGLATPQAGIDLRSGWTVYNAKITDWVAPTNPTPADQLGLVALRNLQNSDSNFNAKQRTSFQNCYVEASAKTAGSAPVIQMQGVRIDAIDNDLRNIVIRNCGEGARISQREGNVFAVNTRECTNGIILAQSSSSTDADQYTLSGCVARDNTGAGFIVGSGILNASLMSCVSRGNDVGLEVESGATDTRVLGGSIFSNTTSDIDDSGTNTTVIANEGGIESHYPTRLELVTDVSNDKVASIGQRVNAADFEYEYDGTSTVLSDLPGWKPVGRAEPQHFGVLPGATDYQTEMDAWLTNAYAGNPSAISVPGTYTIGGVISSGVSGDVDVIINSGAEITAASGFTANNKMIQTTNTGSGTGHVFSWVGGKYNCENQPNSATPSEANDIFYFTAQNCSNVRIHLDRTYGGVDYRTAGGDSHIFIVADNAEVSIGECVGAQDVGIYISGDSTSSTIGHRLKARGNYRFCNNAILAKRQYEDIDIRAFVSDSNNGVGYADDAEVGGVAVQGGTGGIIDVTTRRVQRSCTVQGGGEVTVRVNASEIGLALTGGTPVISTSAQALYLGGCHNVLGDVNVVNVNSGCTLNNNFNAVLCGERTIDATTYQAEFNTVRVQSRNIGRPVIEQNSSNNNNFNLYAENSSANSTIVGDKTYVKEIRDGQLLEALGALPTNLTTTAVTERSSGSSNFLEAVQSAVGWQILVKNLSGTIFGRIIYSISASTWSFRVNDVEKFQVNDSGPEAPSYTVAGLPTSGRGPGTFVYASDGRKNGEGAGLGTGVLVFYDGSNWIAVDSGQTVTA